METGVWFAMQWRNVVLFFTLMDQLASCGADMFEFVVMPPPLDQRLLQLCFTWTESVRSGQW